MSEESEFDKIYRQTYLGELTSAEKKEEITITLTCGGKPFTTTTKEKPNLLKGIEIKDYDYGELVEPTIEYVTNKAEITNINSPALYKKLFDISKIANKKTPENVKYLEIGKTTNEGCNKQKENFEAFIVEYCKILANNKYHLLCKLRECMIANMKLTANCDFNNLESMSNKWLDDSFKGRTNDGIKKYLNDITKIVKLKVDKLIHINLTSEEDKELNAFETLISQINTGGIQVQFTEDSQPQKAGALTDFFKSKKTPVQNSVYESSPAVPIKNVPITNAPITNVPKSVVPNRFVATAKNVARGFQQPQSQSRLRSKNMNFGDYDIGVAERNEIYKNIYDIIKTERTNIMCMHELFNNQFCSIAEMGKTAEKSQKDVWWQRTPSLVAYTVASATFSANSAIFILENEADISPGVSAMATHLQEYSGDIVSNATSAIALATFINAAVGPIVGVAVGALIGTILESKWYKSLRSTRLENITFQRFINNNDEYINIMNTTEFRVNGNVCSYRKHLKEYIFRCLFASAIRKSYNDLSKKMYEDPLDKLKYYLFVYDDCLIANKFLESTPETKAVSDIKTEIGKRGQRKILGITPGTVKYYEENPVRTIRSSRANNKSNKENPNRASRRSRANNKSNGKLNTIKEVEEGEEGEEDNNGASMGGKMKNKTKKRNRKTRNLKKYIKNKTKRNYKK